MIAATVFYILVTLALVGLLWRKDVTHARTINDLNAGHHKERCEWRAERRFLIDRIISRHAGEVVMLEREDTRKNETHEPDIQRPERYPIEGL